MLALEDDTEWDTSGFDFESYVDESLFSTGSRFHLFFGQQNPEKAAQKTWPVYAALALSLLSRTRPLPVSSGYAVPAMQWAVGQGLINGTDGKLLPTGTATRCQFAAILNRFYTAQSEKA